MIFLGLLCYLIYNITRLVYELLSRYIKCCYNNNNNDDDDDDDCYYLWTEAVYKVISHKSLFQECKTETTDKLLPEIMAGLNSESMTFVTVRHSLLWNDNWLAISSKPLQEFKHSPAATLLARVPGALSVLRGHSEYKLIGILIAL